jgi:hypothetical protein
MCGCCCQYSGKDAVKKKRSRWDPALISTGQLNVQEWQVRASERSHAVTTWEQHALALKAGVIFGTWSRVLCADRSTRICPSIAVTRWYGCGHSDCIYVREVLRDPSTRSQHAISGPFMTGSLDGCCSIWKSSVKKRLMQRSRQLRSFGPRCNDYDDSRIIEAAKAAQHTCCKGLGAFHAKSSVMSWVTDCM